MQISSFSLSPSITSQPHQHWIIDIKSDNCDEMTHKKILIYQTQCDSDRMSWVLSKPPSQPNQNALCVVCGVEFELDFGFDNLISIWKQLKIDESSQWASQWDGATTDQYNLIIQLIKVNNEAIWEMLENFIRFYFHSFSLCTIHTFSHLNSISLSAAAVLSWSNIINFHAFSFNFSYNYFAELSNVMASKKLNRQLSYEKKNIEFTNFMKSHKINIKTEKKTIE